MVCTGQTILYLFLMKSCRFKLYFQRYRLWLVGVRLVCVNDILDLIEIRIKAAPLFDDYAHFKPIESRDAYIIPTETVKCICGELLN